MTSLVYLEGKGNPKGNLEERPTTQTGMLTACLGSSSHLAAGAFSRLHCRPVEKVAYEGGCISRSPYVCSPPTLSLLCRLTSSDVSVSA